MASGLRRDRVARLIHKEVNTLFLMGFLDKSVSMLRVIDVEMASDLSYARLYVFSVGDAALLDIGYLNDQKRRIRHMLAKRLALRRMPNIGFYAYCGEVPQAELRDNSDEVSGSDIVDKD